jgi:hypothetical protein
MAGEMPTSLAPATIADSLHPIRGYGKKKRKHQNKNQLMKCTETIRTKGSNRNHVEQRRAEDLLLLLLVPRTPVALRPRGGSRRRPVGPARTGLGGGGRGARALRLGRLGAGLQRRCWCLRRHRRACGETAGSDRGSGREGEGAAGAGGPGEEEARGDGGGHSRGARCSAERRGLVFGARDGNWASGPRRAGLEDRPPCVDANGRCRFGCGWREKPREAGRAVLAALRHATYRALRRARASVMPPLN